MTMTPDLAENLANVIVSCGDQAAAALVQLLYATADPSGDKSRYETAWVAIRTAIPFTSDYDLMIKDYCAGREMESVQLEARTDRL